LSASAPRTADGSACTMLCGSWWMITSACGKRRNTEISTVSAMPCATSSVVESSSSRWSWIR